MVMHLDALQPVIMALQQVYMALQPVSIKICTFDSYCQGIRLIFEFVPRAMDELPIWQSRSQPVNPSHVTINGLAHYCTHNASVNNSI